MFTVLQTDEFKDWLDGLADRKVRNIVRDRLIRMEGGNLGRWESVGKGVSEAKIDYGPGYRLYFTRAGLQVIVLLCGGDKSTQKGDIRKAQTMAAEVPKD